VASDWEQRNRRAWQIGYDNAYQRRELRSAAREGDEEELASRLSNLIAARMAEEDYASVGEIFADLYDEMAGDAEDKTEFLRGIFSPAGI